MLSLFKAILSALLLVCCTLVAVDAHERKFDCSSVTPSILSVYGTRCAADKFQAEQDLLKRFDMIEECSCELLRHTLVWESLLTHEVETLYMVAKERVEEKDKEEKEGKENKEFEVARTDAIYRDDLGGRMYFWDRFAAIMKGADTEVKKNRLTMAIMDNFAKIYYQPDSYTMPFKKAGLTDEVRVKISEACKGLKNDFANFVGFFGKLIVFSANPRYVYRLTAYDDNLYKLLSVYKMCQFMVSSGELD